MMGFWDVVPELSGRLSARREAEAEAERGRAGMEGENALKICPARRGEVATSTAFLALCDEIPNLDAKEHWRQRDDG